MEMKNPAGPTIPQDHQGRFFTASDGTRIFLYDHQPADLYRATIFLIAGITGINHHGEKDLIDLLSNGQHRVVVIHPRGTGYSEGKRGALSRFDLLLDDLVEIITDDEDQQAVFLFGHSMSCAVLTAIAGQLEGIRGAILVNPPYVLKKSKGMSPSWGDYIKYAWHALFARHKPIVNMAGNPDLIENEEDLEESRARIKDPLLVRYFSLYMMTAVNKLLKSMPKHAKAADYPLLLLQGTEDNIVDPKGAEAIFNAWKCKEKEFHLVEGGSHGKSTVLLSRRIINEWMASKMGN